MVVDELLRSCRRPELYQRGTSSFWTDPHVSVQMLRQQLDTRHEVASRSSASNARIVEWMLDRVDVPRMELLDLGCGPGLYAELLAGGGHAVTGVDISSVAVHCARRRASDRGLDIEYLRADYLTLRYESRFDLVILMFLDFSLLAPRERAALLRVVSRALKPGGAFVFDAMNLAYPSPRNLGQVMPRGWEVREKGFWGPTPHLVLTASYHWPDERVIANHHVVVDRDEAERTFLVWNRYFAEDEVRRLLEQAGLGRVEAHPGLLPPKDCWSGDNVTFYVAWK